MFSGLYILLFIRVESNHVETYYFVYKKKATEDSYNKWSSAPIVVHSEIKQVVRSEIKQVNTQEKKGKALIKKTYWFL